MEPPSALLLTGNFLDTNLPRQGCGSACLHISGDWLGKARTKRGDLLALTRGHIDPPSPLEQSMDINE